jgi:hypothetical protein
MLEPVEDWISRVRSRPQVPDLVEELIPAKSGLILLGGRTGIGKTNLVLQLAFSVATGVEFLGLGTRKADVGYLGFEGAPDKMADRLEKLARSFSDWQGHLRFAVRTPLKLEGNEAQFLAMFEGVGLAILDPLKYLVSGDYIKPADAQRFVARLLMVAEELGAPILVSHHIRKPDKRLLIEPGDLYELKGAGDYVEAATTVMLLERERQGHRPTGGFAPVIRDHAVLYFPKTRDAVEAAEPIPMRFDRERLLFVPRGFEPVVYT